MNRWTRA